MYDWIRAVEHDDSGTRADTAIYTALRECYALIRGANKGVCMSLHISGELLRVQSSPFSHLPPEVNLLTTIHLNSYHQSAPYQRNNTMAITPKVKSQYFGDEAHVIRLAPSNPQLTAATSDGSRNAWTLDEHDRFLEALERHPSGPWKIIALFVGSRDTRQTMAHAQKYRERIARQRQAAAITASNNNTSSSLVNFQLPSENYQAPQQLAADFDVKFVNDLVGNFDVEADLEIDAEEQLLLTLSQTYEVAPFSSEEAQWIAEHHEAISLLAHTGGGELRVRGNLSRSTVHHDAQHAAQRSIAAGVGTIAVHQVPDPNEWFSYNKVTVIGGLTIARLLESYEPLEIDSDDLI